MATNVKKKSLAKLISLKEIGEALVSKKINTDQAAPLIGKIFEKNPGRVVWVTKEELSSRDPIKEIAQVSIEYLDSLYNGCQETIDLFTVSTEIYTIPTHRDSILIIACSLDRALNAVQKFTDSRRGLSGNGFVAKNLAVKKLTNSELTRFQEESKKAMESIRDKLNSKIRRCFQFELHYSAPRPVYFDETVMVEFFTFVNSLQSVMGENYIFCIKRLSLFVIAKNVEDAIRIANEENSITIKDKTEFQKFGIFEIKKVLEDLYGTKI